MDILSELAKADLVVNKLFDEASLVGGVYTMGYEKCYVITNDKWKEEAGGIPKHCFLLATTMDTDRSPDFEEQEAVLLRTIGPAKLPDEDELVRARSEAMRETVEQYGPEAASTSGSAVDILTQNEMQFSALEAKILGTFYGEDVGGKPFLKFGSDVENFYAASQYKVYKPFGKSLQMIGSYPQLTQSELENDQIEERLTIGDVRYTSTLRRQKQHNGQSTMVPVEIRPDDFIAMKTAVFGMTRLGKSNTMKVIALATFERSLELDEAIGQLIFDPSGEYSNYNPQDETALAEIGNEFVSIYGLVTQSSQDHVKPLITNFFEEDLIEVTWSIINSYLKDETADYVKNFLSANVIGPEEPGMNRSAYSRAERRRNALYATLIRAGYDPEPNQSFSFQVNNDVVQIIDAEVDFDLENKIFGQGKVSLDSEELVDFFLAIWDQREESAIEDWLDEELEAILKVLSGSTGSGFKKLAVPGMKTLHSNDAEDDYVDKIIEELYEGKIVIIDLSSGSESVAQFASERIVIGLMKIASEKFNRGEEPNKIQIFVEEAHRLFDRDKENKPAEEDPYVRLAKESAKFKIGVVYATQEVTSVDRRVLSNTSNWVITHLNNKNEIKELSKYYNFEDFEELTLQAEDIGFVRLKTRSNRFIIPTQIRKFSSEMIEKVKILISEDGQEAGE